MAEQADKQGGIGAYLSTLVSIGKDGVALLRDAALLLALLLVGWPETFNDILVRAGFEEAAWSACSGGPGSRNRTVNWSRPNP